MGKLPPPLEKSKIQQQRLHKSAAKVKFTPLQISQKSCWSHCVIQVVYFPCWDMGLLYILRTGQVIKSQQYSGREASGSFSSFGGSEEGGTPLLSFTPVEISGSCLTWWRKADSYGKVTPVSKVTQLAGRFLPIVWVIWTKLWKRLKTSKEDPGALVLPPGVGWPGLLLILSLKKKGKPEEREEEKSAFENLFFHSQWASLSTYSFGHVVVNTIFLIIIVWGLWKASRWEPDKPVVKVNIDSSLDGPSHLQQGCGSLGCGAGDTSLATLWARSSPEAAPEQHRHHQLQWVSFSHPPEWWIGWMIVVFSSFWNSGFGACISPLVSHLQHCCFPAFLGRPQDYLVPLQGQGF